MNNLFLKILFTVLFSITVSGCATSYDQETDHSANPQSNEVNNASNDVEVSYQKSSNNKHRILAAGSHVSGAILGS